jgi:hypothetical protein
MRIPVNAADCGGVRIDVVTVAEQTFFAEVALAAKDVERHEHAIAGFQILDVAADLLDHADELVAERLSDTRIRHEAVIQVQVRPADAGAHHTHDGVARVLYFGDRLVDDTHAIRASISHCKHLVSPVEGDWA